MIDPIFEIKTEKETPNFGIYVVEPLQQGYGQTLGNSLRRILLSSLLGTAVTQVKIAGVKHQFTTIPGLKEDVVELILNIKQIRVSSRNDKPQKITVDKFGPGEVTAGDIEVPAGVEIFNKDLVLGNLSDKKSRLKMEMVIESGYGYLFAEEKAAGEIGVIPVDALFSPVTKVNFRVGITRVGRAINWDRLTMEITTDGTMFPKDALIQAGKILVNFSQQLVTPKKQAKKAEEKTGQLPKELMETSVEELELPTRIANSLIKGGINNIGDLLKTGKQSIVKIKNLGTKSIKIIEAAVKEKGLEIPELS